MEELEDSWKRLALIEQEQEVVEIDVDDAQIDGEDKYVLVGSLWTDRPFNNQAMIGLMKTLWRPRKGMEIDILSYNKFMFTFYWKGDVERILKGRPWMFDKHVLLLQQIQAMEQPSQVILDKATYWIRLYDLPVGDMNENVIAKLASKAGRVISISHKKDYHMGGRYVRVRVEVEAGKPVVRGSLLKFRGGTPMFINFKYERLRHFCYHCERLATQTAITRRKQGQNTLPSMETQCEHHRRRAEEDECLESAYKQSLR